MPFKTCLLLSGLITATANQQQLENNAELIKMHSQDYRKTAWFLKIFKSRFLFLLKATLILFVMLSRTLLDNSNEESKYLKFSSF